MALCESFELLCELFELITKIYLWVCSEGRQRGQAYLFGPTSKWVKNKQKGLVTRRREWLRAQSILHELSVELRKPWKQKQHSQLRFTAQGPVLFIFSLQNQPCYYSCSGRSWLVKYSVWEGWRKLFEFHHNKVHFKVTKVLVLHANTWPLSNGLISL